MASIAYITDKEMIEYHRLNGHNSINFYRPNNKKNIVNFSEGDLLFFMSKKTEKGKKREKGIVGYGILSQATTHSLKKMWDNYGKLCGYDSFELLKEGIPKVFKLDKMPRSFNCFYLTNVNYFKTPIYLSEFGYNISNKIESFFYLDKEEDLTNLVLEKASDIGLDLWSSTMNDSINAEDLNQTLIAHNLSTIASLVNFNPYDSSHTSKLSKLKNKLVAFQQVKDCEYLYYRIHKKDIEILALCAYNSKTFTQVIVGLIGVKELLIKHMINDSNTITYKLALPGNINNAQRNYLEQLSIDYIIL